MTVILHVQDDDLWKRTLQAAADTQERKAPRIDIRCTTCGTWLGALDVMQQGPLFLSAFDTPPPDTWAPTGMKVLTADGEVDPATFFAELPHRDYGSAAARGRECVVALIGDGLAEYPDLLVRCPKDGDLILNRAAALAKLREHPPGKRGKWSVRPAFPRHDDLQVREDGWDILAGQSRKFTTVTQVTGRSDMLRPN